MLLGIHNKGWTASHVATKLGNLEILQQVWEWAKGKLTTDEINYELLLGMDSEGWTAWHVAAIRGNLEMLQEIWEWVKRN